MNEQEKIVAITFFLIDLCRKTGAKKLTITQENVKKHRELLGDWEIIVRRKKAKK